MCANAFNKVATVLPISCVWPLWLRYLVRSIHQNSYLLKPFLWSNIDFDELMFDCCSVYFYISFSFFFKLWNQTLETLPWGAITCSFRPQPSSLSKIIHFWNSYDKICIIREGMEYTFLSAHIFHKNSFLPLLFGKTKLKIWIGIILWKQIKSCILSTCAIRNAWLNPDWPLADGSHQNPYTYQQKNKQTNKKSVSVDISNM